MENKPADNPAYRSRRGREPYRPNQSDDVGMMAMVKKCFTQYADFSSRARRSEYWYFTLFNTLVIIPLYMVTAILGSGRSEAVVFPAIFMLLYFLVSFIPRLAVAARRLHDTGRSGWYYLLNLIPVIGGVILIILFAEDSKPGVNQWGANPKGIGNRDFDPTAFDDKYDL